MHRPPMDWAAAGRRVDRSGEGRLFGGIRRLAALRAGVPELHAQARSEAVWVDNPRVFALLRDSARGRLLVVANVSPHPTTVELPEGWWSVTDLVTGEPLEQNAGLAPYQVRWLRPRPR